MSKSLYALRCGLSEKTKQNKKQGGGGGCVGVVVVMKTTHVNISMLG